MPSKITNRAGIDLRIGPYLLPTGASFLVGDIGTALAASIARGHVTQVVMPEGSYSITNNAKATIYIGGIYLEPGQTTVFDTLPDNADSAFINGTLSYEFKPALGTNTGGVAPVALANKTLTYAGDKLVQVDEFTNATKTVLLKRKTLVYTGDLLTSILTYNGSLSFVSTRTLTYSSGVLISVTES